MYPGCCQAPDLTPPQELCPAFSFYPSDYNLLAVHDCIIYRPHLFSIFSISSNILPVQIRWRPKVSSSPVSYLPNFCQKGSYGATQTVTFFLLFEKQRYFSFWLWILLQLTDNSHNNWYSKTSLHLFLAEFYKYLHKRWQRIKSLVEPKVTGKIMRVALCCLHVFYCITVKS